MPSVVLQFVGDVDLESRVIEYRGSWKYSHVDIVCPDGRLQGCRSDITGGAPAGCQIRSPDYEEWAHVARITIPCSTAQLAKFWKYADSKLGEAYNSEGIIGIILDNVRLNNKHELFCSEYASLCLSASGLFPHPLAIPANLIDPNNLFLAASIIGEVDVIR